VIAVELSVPPPPELDPPLPEPLPEPPDEVPPGVDVPPVVPPDVPPLVPPVAVPDPLDEPPGALPDGGGAGCEAAGAGAAAAGDVFWVVLPEPELPQATSKNVEQTMAAESAPMRPNEADASIFITRPHETIRMLCSTEMGGQNCGLSQLSAC
jgi:hypothetical protein